MKVPFGNLPEQVPCAASFNAFYGDIGRQKYGRTDLLIQGNTDVCSRRGTAGRKPPQQRPRQARRAQPDATKQRTASFNGREKTIPRFIYL